MKQCLACGGISLDGEKACRRCGKRLTSYKPAPSGAILDEQAAGDGPIDEVGSVSTALPASGESATQPRSSVLRWLGVLFYVVVGLNTLGFLASLGDTWLAVGFYGVAAVSSLFFGAICFAADDIRLELSRIHDALRDR
jgi:hypothetical protein